MVLCLLRPKLQRLTWLAIAVLFLSPDDSGDDEEPAAPADKSELHHTLKTLSLKLNDLSTCNDLIAKHGAALQRSLNELDSLKIPSESGEKLKVVNERATLFRITSNAMINVSAPTAPSCHKGKGQPISSRSLSGGCFTDKASAPCGHKLLSKANSLPQAPAFCLCHFLHAAIIF